MVLKREEFGKICASLRQELLNAETGRAWGQRELAEKTKLSPRMIGQVERGERVNLESDLLARYADVFHLTSAERERFFSLANHISHESLSRDSLTIDDCLGRTITKVESVRQPVLIHDGLYRIIGMNSAYKAIYGLTDAYLDSILDDDATKFHVVRHIHDENSPVREVYKSQIGAAELNNAIYWRYLSLGHRHEALYEAIQAKLLNLFPRFNYLYGSLNYQLSHRDSSGILRTFRSKHPHFGLLSYLILSTHLFGGDRELFMAVLIPSDEKTSRLFEQLVHAGNFSFECFEPVKSDLRQV